MPLVQDFIGDELVRRIGSVYPSLATAIVGVNAASRAYHAVKGGPHPFTRSSQQVNRWLAKARRLGLKTRRPSYRRTYRRKRFSGRRTYRRRSYRRTSYRRKPFRRTYRRRYRR